jgi:hypothetical protein
MIRIALAIAALASANAIPAHGYSVDWSVNDLGGMAMVSASFQTVNSLGQTVVGRFAGSSFQAFLGYWQIGTQAAVREPVRPVSPGEWPTTLLPPTPNPFRVRVAVHYSLAAESRTTIELVDLSGRVVRTLVNTIQRPGRYRLSWSGTDDRGRLLANGVYFCKFSAGDYRATQKLVLQR